MFCRKCRAELSDTASFCNKCGTQLLRENKPEKEKRTEGKYPVSLAATRLLRCGSPKQAQVE